MGNPSTTVIIHAKFEYKILRICYFTGGGSNFPYLIYIFCMSPTALPVIMRHRDCHSLNFGIKVGAHGERWARAYNRGLRAEPTEPVVRESGAKICPFCYLVNCSNMLFERILLHLAVSLQTSDSSLNLSCLPLLNQFFCVHATISNPYEAWICTVHFSHRLFLAVCIHDKSHP